MRIIYFFTLMFVLFSSAVNAYEKEKEISVSMSKLASSEWNSLIFTTSLPAPFNQVTVSSKKQESRLYSIQLTIEGSEQYFNVSSDILSQVADAQLHTFHLFHETSIMKKGWALALHFKYGLPINESRCGIDDGYPVYKKAEIYFNLSNEDVELQRYDECGSVIE